MKQFLREMGDYTVGSDAPVFGTDAARPQFDFFLSQILPSLLAKAGCGGRLRLWIARCAKGQQAYQIAASILCGLPEAIDRDIRVLATDADTANLEIARRGRYRGHDLPEMLPADLGKLYRRLKARDCLMYQASENLRSIIRFNQLCIEDHWPMSGGFNVIFSNNATVGLSTASKINVFEGFQRLLGQDGMLFLGMKEHLPQEAEGTFFLKAPKIYGCCRAFSED